MEPWKMEFEYEVEEELKRYAKAHPTKICPNCRIVISGSACERCGHTIEIFYDPTFEEYEKKVEAESKDLKTKEVKDLKPKDLRKVKWENVPDTVQEEVK
jgi:hypothetical protein